MALGMPCVATLCTAHLDYCTPENVFPLTNFTTEIAKDETPFFSGNATWQRCDAKELVSQIDAAWGDNQLCAAKGKLAEKSIRELDGWVVSANRIAEFLLTNGN